MSFKVAIRKNETGETRFYETDEIWDRGFRYMWTEGNYSCDCNRHLFFERAAGNEPEWDDCGCGDIKYAALYAVLPDNSMVMLDE